MPIAAATVVPLVATGASVGASLAGGLFSNSTNKKIARETNKLNYQMFQEGQQYNWDMWNATNEYNSPLNARKRLQEAGYNPAALLDAQQLGAASQVSGPSPNPAVGWQYQSPLNAAAADLAQLPNVLLAAAQTKKTAEEAKNVEIQNKWQDITLSNAAKLMEQQGLLASGQAAKFEQDIEWTRSNWDKLVSQLDLDIAYKQNQAELSKIEKTLQEVYGSKLKEAELANLAEQLRYTVELGDTERAKQILMRAQKDSTLADAASNRIIANSTATKNYTDAERVRLENEVYRLFGKGQAAQNLLNSIYEGKIKSADAFFKKLEQSYYDPDFRGKKMAKAADITKWIGHNLSNLLPILRQIKF